MVIKVTCGACNQSFLTHATAADRAAKCPGCGSRVAVPGLRRTGRPARSDPRAAGESADRAAEVESAQPRQRPIDDPASASQPGATAQPSPLNPESSPGCPLCGERLAAGQGVCAACADRAADLRAAQEELRSRLGDAARTELAPDEYLYCLAEGRRRFVLATDRRVLVLRQSGWPARRAGAAVEDVPYHAVAEIHARGADTGHPHLVLQQVSGQETTIEFHPASAHELLIFAWEVEQALAYHRDGAPGPDHLLVHTAGDGPIARTTSP